MAHRSRRLQSSSRHRTTDHPIQDIRRVPIVAHPVVCFNGVITIVNGHLIQEVGITLAPHVVRVTSAICPLWNDAIDVRKLGTLTKIARVRPEGDHKGRRCSTYLMEPSISNNDKLGRMLWMLDRV